MGDIARLHSAVIAYARDFMIDRGFTYCVPPFMIHGNVVNGVMSFAEMESMMYKIEGEDLYLIGTSEHSMIGKFIDQIIPEEELPKTLTSYSPCFRKEKGAHGIEERIKKIMMTIPNIIDPSVPIGKDDSENVEVQKFGDPVVPDFEIPYHTEIMERFNGIDLDSARRVAGNGFYYLMGDIARLHSAVIAYARDFMICLLYTSPSPRDRQKSRMPSSA